MKRALIIDDDRQARNVLRQMLEHCGFEAMEAASGTEAIEQFRTSPTDVVVTDLVMPDQDGLELIKQFRSEFPQVRILAVSGGIRGHARSADLLLIIAQDAGAFGIVKKPFTLAELRDALAKLTESPQQE